MIKLFAKNNKPVADKTPVSYVPPQFHSAVWQTSQDACSVWGISFKYTQVIYTLTLTYAGKRINWDKVDKELRAYGLPFTTGFANAFNMSCEHACNFVQNAEWANLGE